MFGWSWQIRSNWRMKSVGNVITLLALYCDAGAMYCYAHSHSEFPSVGCGFGARGWTRLGTGVGVKEVTEGPRSARGCCLDSPIGLGHVRWTVLWCSSNPR